MNRRLSPTCRPLWAAALIALAGCATAPMMPRTLFPITGTVQLEPPVRGGGMTIERMDLQLARMATNPQSIRMPQNLWIELRMSAAGTVRAEDFELIRTPLAEFELSAGDDLTPRRATGLAAAPGDALSGSRTVAADGRVWLSFTAIELRALNAAGGHPVPLAIELRHRDGAAWMLSDPARGLPEWRREPNTLGFRLAVGMYGSSGPADSAEAAAPFGGDRGGDGIGVAYDMGITADFDGPFVGLSGGLRAGSRSVFADDEPGLDPRAYGRSALEFNGTLLVGWHMRLPQTGETALGARLGIGWQIISVLDRVDPSDGGEMNPVAIVHALPIELVLTTEAALPMLPVVNGSGGPSFGVFFRLEPRLGALSGDARYGDGFSFVTGIEVGLR